MKLEITSGLITGLAEQLERLGFDDLGGIKFYRVPFRVGGMWRCTVIL